MTWQNFGVGFFVLGGGGFFVSTPLIRRLVVVLSHLYVNFLFWRCITVPSLHTCSTHGLLSF